MIIKNKSLIAILFSLTVPFLSQAKSPGILESIGGLFLGYGIAMKDISNDLLKKESELIAKGLGLIHLEKFGYSYTMNARSWLYIITGTMAIMSPMIFSGAEYLGKQYRNKKNGIPNELK